MRAPPFPSRGSALLALCFSLASLTANTLDFPVAGFRIEALESAPGGTTASPLFMCLPPTNEFAPNVNVQIQPHADSMDAYVKLSKAQFEQAKWKVLAERRDPADTWTVEYRGSASGRDLHFYSRAISNGKFVYLATATARADQWETVGEKLKRCVDSFALP